MQITGIIPLDKKRSRVYIDEEFAFVLYKGELRKLGINEGEDLDEETYREISEVLLPKRAKLRAMNLLKSRTYTEKQLRDKLRDGEYPKEIIDAAIEYVSSYNYINDQRYAEEYIRIHASDKSRTRMKQDLIKKGIGSGTIEAAFEMCEEEGFGADELAQALKLLEKRGYTGLDGIDPKEWNKHYAFLARRGYSSEIIRKAMGGDLHNYT